ncbi:hypothetical protein AB0I69_06440 [Streptomyces sp. NPDC050508]|uniref:hypothetical protein n=1 Tax=Streptomyces sp. NPDC050508 TaxID=3155405 RepID=UPI00342EFF98
MVSGGLYEVDVRPQRGQVRVVVDEASDEYRVDGVHVVHDGDDVFGAGGVGAKRPEIYIDGDRVVKQPPLVAERRRLGGPGGSTERDYLPSTHDLRMVVRT